MKTRSMVSSIGSFSLFNHREVILIRDPYQQIRDSPAKTAGILGRYGARVHRNHAESIHAINVANQRLREQHNQRIAEIAGMMQGLPQGAAALIAPDPTYLDAAQPENFERFARGKKQEHSQAFPLSDNMLIIIQSELSEGQQARIVSSLTRGGPTCPSEWRRQIQDLLYP